LTDEGCPWQVMASCREQQEEGYDNSNSGFRAKSQYLLCFDITKANTMVPEVDWN
jgi:hypothetical protein